VVRRSAAFDPVTGRAFDLLFDMSGADLITVQRRHGAAA
jgi:hypothetical protein